MKNRTKVQYVPTVLLDTVLAVKLKQHQESKKQKKYTASKKVVIYKMISTEEWKKKEDARIAKEAKLKELRESPKLPTSMSSILSSAGLSKRKPKSSEQQRKKYNEYYFANKEKIRLYQKNYRERKLNQLKLSKAKIPPTDAAQ